jgi:putative ABC transport system permease protein
MFYFIIGYRNIIKNFRRSVITMIPIIIGMISCLLTQGFFHWNINELKESMIHHGIGHYQLFAAGFSKHGNDEPYQYLIADATPILKELRRLPGVELVTPRMAFNGILSSGDRSTVVAGEAGNPGNEMKLNSYSGLRSGTRLNSAKPYGVMIGAGIARKLSAKIGDTLTLMSNMSDGGINAVDLEVAGITGSGYSGLDQVSVMTSLGVAQELLNMGRSVQKLVVLLKDTRETKRILPKIAAISAKYHLEYRDWETLAEFYHSVKLMYDVVYYIIILIVLAIVTFAISNTVNMTINERFREIGTMRALGTRRIQVAPIFVAESLLIGLGGGLIGLILSYLFIGFTEIIGGLPVVVNSSAGQPASMHVFFHPELTAILSCVALFSLVAMVAAIIPSRRAAKISITDALRWV